VFAGCLQHEYFTCQIYPLSKEILDAAYTVHTEMGPGLLESIYEECLCMELTERGFTYVRQRPVYINYKGESTNLHFRLDLLIEDQIVVELKAVMSLSEFTKLNYSPTSNSQKRRSVCSSISTKST